MLDEHLKTLENIYGLYFLTFTVFQHSFKLQNIRNISEVEQEPISTTVLLEENKHYDITIESLKNGQILSVKSFKTRK